MNTDKSQIALAASQPNGSFEWRVSVDGGMAQGPKHYPQVAVNANQYGELTFTIVNSKTITFAKDNPIFVGPAASTKPTSLDSQFTFSGQGTQTLTVHDSNKTAGPYNYVINFDGGAPPLDPIIQNGGGCCTRPGFGGTALSSTSFIAYLALAFLVGVIVTLLAQRLFRRS